MHHYYLPQTRRHTDGRWLAYHGSGVPMVWGRCEQCAYWFTQLTWTHTTLCHSCRHWPAWLAKLTARSLTHRLFRDWPTQPPKGGRPYAE